MTHIGAGRGGSVAFRSTWLFVYSAAADRANAALRVRMVSRRLATIGVLSAAALAGCDQDTFDPNKEKWNYLVCTLQERKQPEHVAFAVREDGKAVAAYLRKVLSATVTPFEVVFDYYKDGTGAKWRISRTDGTAEMSDYYRIYRGTCVKAEGAKF